ncbi:MAG: MmcQ/YjbR family DNA-binding protein [Thermoguttaceae bacterium]|nr:MmcQ/YjbR family DNA-binding protein [Thermoguttaceae bacterium]
MNPEQEAFQKKSIIEEKLIPFGFKKRKNGYRYVTRFMDEHFQAEILIDKKGAVSGKVIDLDVNEEYLPIRVDSRIGAYVSQVRRAYMEILHQIAASCCRDEQFIFPQTNRIVSQIELRYGETPDYPFAKYPEFAVFRYPDNRKWYGLVCPIPKFSLLAKINVQSTDKAIVEILNMKIIPDQLEQLRSAPGFYPCYHMNQSNWISVLLDDSVPDEKILELVDTSRNFATNSSKRGKK